MELRYPISLNPSATVFGLAFLEGGNAWNSFRDFDPFNLKRSAGIGVRVFLPMFGLLGLDYGYRFDTLTGYPNMQKGIFHFIIGQNFN
jgi:outer membrane protein insertion porin family